MSITLEGIHSPSGDQVSYAKSLISDTESSNKQEVHANAATVRHTKLDTTNDSGEAENHGEGIGLLIVRQLCQLLEATIEVDTSSGEGTTFKIRMPMKLGETIIWRLLSPVDGSRRVSFVDERLNGYSAGLLLWFTSLRIVEHILSASFFVK